MRVAIAIGLGALAGCASVFGIPSDVDQASIVDAGSDGSSGGSPDVVVAPTDTGADVTVDPPENACDPTAAFGAPVLLAKVSSAQEAEGSPRLSDDELAIYFDGTRQTNGLFFATRPSRFADFGAESPLIAKGPAGSRFAPNVVDDGLTLFYEYDTADQTSEGIYVSKRATSSDLFPISNQLAFNGVDLMNPFVRSSAPKMIWFATDSDSKLDIDLRLANLDGDGNDGGVSDRLDELNTKDQEFFPVVSADLRTIYFASDRPLDDAPPKSLNVWFAQRATPADRFGTPQPLGGVNLAGVDSMPGWISPSNCRLYLFRQGATLGGGQDIFVASRPSQ